MSILVDSNVILDVLTTHGAWHAWSETALEKFGASERLYINPLIHAEVSVRFTRIEEVEAALPTTNFHRQDLPWAAAFIAGSCYREYRERGGERRSPMPDFYIGAHALLAGHRLLTRDLARYQTYFPKLQLITPENFP